MKIPAQMAIAIHSTRSTLLPMRFFWIPAALLAVAFPIRPSQAAIAEPRLTIEQLTSIFENDTPVLQTTYCQNIHDRRGYTFGIAGFCSGTYDGTLFIREYERLHPGNSLTRYLPALEAIDAGTHDAEGRNPSVAGLRGFPAAFRACGGDPAFIQAQQNLIDLLYWRPSQRIARRIGAKLPITRGQFYDACINLGEDGLVDLVRRTNHALGDTPGRGIPEREWLAKFLDLRLTDKLQGDHVERNSADRVRVYQRLLAQDNVRLTRPIRLTCYGDHFVLR
ncbi:MAG: chitosanase [Terrimicrobiaceae bacterium]|nr:chitosanase [Terrimicrobiaceae bacterium]